jgi:biotin operon repressor
MTLREWQADGHERGQRYVETGVCSCDRCAREPITARQTRAVLRLLQTMPAGVTALDALRLVGSFRLASRIHDLKRAGYVIDREMVKLDNGKRIARYTLGVSQTAWVGAQLREHGFVSEAVYARRFPTFRKHLSAHIDILRKRDGWAIDTRPDGDAGYVLRHAPGEADRRPSLGL